jgi:TolA-binding protein
MHRTVSALAVAAFLAFAVAPAAAQQTPGTGQTPATAQPPATNANRTATTATVQQPNAPTYGQLITALSRTRSEVAQLQTLRNLTTNNVRIVKIQTIVTPDNASALNSAIARNQAPLATLRAALSTMHVTATTDNSTLTIAQFLMDNKIGVNQVIAADVQTGNVMLFIQ